MRARAESRLRARRWLVAGFLHDAGRRCYAYPAYIARPGDMSPDAAQLLRWASWVLTLPVVLFCCTPFFRSAWRDLRQRRIGMDLPVALGMAITFVVQHRGRLRSRGPLGRELYVDSLTMFVFFLLTGRWLESRLRDRTAGALDALMNRLPDSVLRRRADGEFERVAVRRLAVGDMLRVLPGEAFPADGRVVVGDTSADEALITGESRPGRAPLRRPGAGGRPQRRRGGRGPGRGARARHPVRPDRRPDGERLAAEAAARAPGRSRGAAFLLAGAGGRGRGRGRGGGTWTRARP